MRGTYYNFNTQQPSDDKSECLSTLSSGGFCVVKKMENRYLKLATKMVACHFLMYGVGNFTLTTEEMGKILEILVEYDGEGLLDYYKKLENVRMG